MKVEEYLYQMQDLKYQAFSKRIVSTKYEIIGVQVPKLRKMAKALAKDEWISFLYQDTNCYEVMFIKTILIGTLKNNFDELFKALDHYVPLIDNWALCDSLCSGLKMINKHKDKGWLYINKYLTSKKEFELRFATVMMLNYFLDDSYLEEVFKILDKVKSEYYYVNMAIAWTISTAYVKYPKKTYKYLLSSNLDKWTYNKTIQKILESYRVSTDDKEKVKKLRRI